MKQLLLNFPDLRLQDYENRYTWEDQVNPVCPIIVQDDVVSINPAWENAPLFEMVFKSSFSICDIRKQAS